MWEEDIHTAAETQVWLNSEGQDAIQDYINGVRYDEEIWAEIGYTVSEETPTYGANEYEVAPELQSPFVNRLLSPGTCERVGCGYAPAKGKSFCCIKCEQGQGHGKKCSRQSV